MKFRNNIWVSVLVFLGLLMVSRFLTGGRFTFGLFLFPLAIPFLFRGKRDE